MLIFAVIGVELFAGKFYFCNDESKMTESDCVGYMVEDYDIDGTPTGTGYKQLFRNYEVELPKKY